MDQTEVFQSGIRWFLASEQVEMSCEFVLR